MVVIHNEESLYQMYAPFFPKHRFRVKFSCWQNLGCGSVRSCSVLYHVQCSTLATKVERNKLWNSTCLPVWTEQVKSLKFMNISEYPSTALRMLDTVSYAASRRVIIRRFMIVMSRAGSRVEGIDLLHFPAGCRTRRLNQV